MSGADGDFIVLTNDRFGREEIAPRRKLIVATGYYDLPNYLDIPAKICPRCITTTTIRIPITIWMCW